MIKELLAKQLVESHENMRSVLDEVDSNFQVYPPWTIKEILAHIIGWDEVSTTSITAHAKGKEPGTPAARGIDYYNDVSVSARESLSYEHLVSKWVMARSDFINAVRTLPDELFAKPFVFPWGQTGTISEIVGIMVHHENQHAEEIRGIIAEVKKG
jgi:hypothetical protein